MTTTTTFRQLTGILFLGMTAALAHAASDVTAPAAKQYGSPQIFEPSIRAFEAKDQLNPPTPGGIVCVGSSSMVGWHATIQKDLAPLPVIARGFGGSNMNDALYYVDRVVLRYRPRAVVLYEGDNDIAQGIAPEKIRDTFLAFESAVHKRLPDARIYVMSIKPSPTRWNLWAKSIATNKLLQAACAADKRLTFVSTVEAMMSADGKVREDLFKADRLHMNAKGYELWRDVLRPLLVKREMPVAAAAAAATN